MPATPPDPAALPFAAQKLDALRAELADLAYRLEKRGRLDAADIAIATAARLGEFRDELVAANTSTPATGHDADSLLGRDLSPSTPLRLPG